MQSWYHIFPKNPWLSIYAWIAFCILPFFFIFRKVSALEIVYGISMLILFFIAYWLSFDRRGGWRVYFWVSVEMVINIGMTLVFGYVYFSLFLAFVIGSIRSNTGFFIMYGIHVGTTIAAIIFGFFLHYELFISQLPFLLVSVIGVILVPFNSYTRQKRQKLEGQLEDANKRISELIIMEERQRIARDLHDTLGQKLSLIGLKSDLAGKLVDRNAESAKKELKDIQQTARTALKEVRELVSEMRGTKLPEELARVQQLLEAAGINFLFKGDLKSVRIPLLVENVLSMCLKEAVTNVVKHSGAETCIVFIRQTKKELLLTVQDDGTGIPESTLSSTGNGLAGMRERLEFINGSMEMESINGTVVKIRVPSVILHSAGEGSA
ncbi:sensor histidine kinase [Planococcus lenghuensis]|uniref:histidine kinase n=1 Tax=Planococcus lenghuensis TaxID=2213202 RepID=A0A1Q2KV94_9BACL|nr:sensor histidine kinase [Planococcus lenghuensis]AQQ52046.1 sensor histidine kinase [Planococcus lenghuensis]